MIKTNMIKKSATFFLLASAVAVITAWAPGGVSVVAQVAATVRPDLTGQWQLNRDLSEDAREKLQSIVGGGGDTDGRGHGPGHREGPAAAVGTPTAAATDRAIAEGPAAAAVEGERRTHSWER